MLAKPGMALARGLSPLAQQHTRLHGCVCYFLFNEVAINLPARRIWDYSGNGNHGSAAVGFSYLFTSRGLAGDFNGTSGVVTVNDKAAILDPVGMLTIAAWIKFDTLPGATNQSVCDKQSNSALDSYGLIFLNGTSKFLFGTQGANVQTVTTSWATNTWYHIAATFNDVKDTSVLYVNGVQDNINSAHTDTITNVTTNLTIGNNDVNGSPLDGQMAEFRLYNRDLRPSEIRSLYLRPYLEWEWATQRVFGEQVNVVAAAAAMFEAKYGLSGGMKPLPAAGMGGVLIE